MAALYFKIKSDWEEVVKLRNEIEKLKKELLSFGSSSTPQAVEDLQNKLSSATSRMKELTSDAAKAGAELDQGFKKKIFDASNVVNDLSESITAQRGSIQKIKNELSGLKEKYREALKIDADTSGLEKQIKETNAKLIDQKNVLFGLTQQQAEARLSVKRLKDEYALFKEEGASVVNVTNNMGFSLGKMFAALGGAAALKSLASNIISIRGEYQAMDTAIQTLLGSKEKADELMLKVKEYAKISPLELKDVSAATQMMLGFNIEAEKVPRFLAAIGDVSMGDTQRFNSLALAFSQMSAAGKLMGQDFNQMINAGFNPLMMMSEKTGKSISTLKDEMSKGAISAEMVQQTFIDATSAGGKFYQMSENASKTINGQISMMNEALNEVFNELGEKSEGFIIKSIETTTSLIKNYETIGRGLSGLLVTYGSYRAAVILATLAENGHSAAITLARTRILLAQKAQALLNATMLANPYVAAAAALGVLVGAMITFSDSTTAAEKKQKELHSHIEDINNKSQERKQKIDSLVQTIRDETTAETEAAKALKELRDLIPETTKGLSDQAIKTGELTSFTKAYNEELSKQIGLEKQRELNQLYAQKRSLENSIKQDRSTKGYKYKRRADESQSVLDEVNKQIYELEQEKKEWKDLQNKVKVSPSTYGEDYRKAKKEWEDAKKELERIEKDKDKFTSKQYEDAKKRKETSEKAYKDLGGVVAETSTKKENEAEKIRKQNDKVKQISDKQALEEKRAKVDMTFQVDQARIDAMEEGEEKILAQMDLNHEKEIEQLNRQKEDYIRKYVENERAKFEANPSNKGKSFDESSITLPDVDSVFIQIEQRIRDKQEKDRNDFVDSERQAMNEYLKEYGSYLEKRNALIDIYNEKISKAATEGERLSLGKELESVLADLDIKAKNTTSAISQLFGDMADKTIKELDRINERGESALEFLKGGKWDEAKGGELGITKEVFDVWSKSPDKLKDISDALKGNKEAADNLRPSYDLVKIGLEEMFNAGNDSKKLETAFNKIQSGLGKITNAAGFLSDTLGSLGDAFGSKALGSISESINIATDAIGKGMKGAEAAMSLGLGGIGAAAGAAIGVVSSLAGAIAKIHDKNNERRIEKLQDQIDTLDKSYENLGDSIEKAYSKDASKLIGQQNKLLEQQKKLIQAQIKEEEAKKKTDKERIKDWKDQIEEINKTIADNKEKAVDAIFGEDLQSAIDNFASSYADAWASGTDKAVSAKDTVRNMMKQMATESIKEMIKTSGKMDEIRNKLKEFYADNVLSGWEQDYIYNMAENLQKELDKQFGWADSLMKDKNGKYEQKATSGGFQAMSQDSADELNGRFTALQMTGEEIRLQNESQKQSLSILQLRAEDLVSLQSEQRNIANESLAIMANSYLELQQIRDNTGAIIKPILQMQSDISEVKRNTSRL